MTITNLYFKAGRRNSRSCEDYREIIKRNAVFPHDLTADADDVITIYPKENTRVIIDCNKRTGEFRVCFESKNL